MLTIIDQIWADYETARETYDLRTLYYAMGEAAMALRCDAMTRDQYRQFNQAFLTECFHRTDWMREAMEK